jgi:hypothetical protein
LAVAPTDFVLTVASRGEECVAGSRGEAALLSKGPMIALGAVEVWFTGTLAGGTSLFAPLGAAAGAGAAIPTGAVLVAIGAAV